MRTNFVLVLLVVAGVAAGGCGNKTVGPDASSETPSLYLPPNSPQNVLRNLVSAYTSRDSVETAAVYDTLYQGTSTDPSAPIPIVNFTRADEIHHVHALSHNSNIVSVLVDLGHPSTWQRLPANAGDPADWAIITTNFASIEIVDAGAAIVLESSNRLMEYTFRPRVASPGDTTWTVVRWVEIAN